MKRVTCPKCKADHRIFGSKTVYTCRECKNIWTDNPAPKIPNYDLVGPSTSLTPTQNGLIAAGKVYPGAHVCEAEQHPLLMEMATRHAKYQADHCAQGHQRFQQRADELYKTMGQYKYAEIAAESWERQVNDSPEDLGKEMFYCWERSPGHWSVASVSHKYFGADMALGKDNIWYACILTAD